jgi:5-methyltetrahydrofolate--homocysteine methyltransferase
MFYNAWLSHNEKSVEEQLKNDAEKLLVKWIKDKTIRPSYSVGLFAANSIDAEIIIFDPEKDTELIRLNTFRPDLPALSTLILPVYSGKKDYIGCFAATIGSEVEKIASKIHKTGDFYQSLLIQTLADALAEAFSAYLHKKMRKEWWIFTSKGIRPAVGYPIYPLHSEKKKIFKLLAAQNIGMSLTETFAITPKASVCGLYFSNTDSYNLSYNGR